MNLVKILNKVPHSTSYPTLNVCTKNKWSSYWQTWRYNSLNPRQLKVYYGGSNNLMGVKYQLYTQSFDLRRVSKKIYTYYTNFNSNTLVYNNNLLTKGFYSLWSTPNFQYYFKLVQILVASHQRLIKNFYSSVLNSVSLKIDGFGSRVAKHKSLLIALNTYI